MRAHSTCEAEKAVTSSVDARPSSPRTCDHRRAGAVTFRDPHWQCTDCGRRLEIGVISRGWEVFGQISRYMAYCTILCTCVPVGLCVLSGGRPTSRDLEAATELAPVPVRLDLSHARPAAWRRPAVFGSPSGIGVLDSHDARALAIRSLAVND